MFTEEKILYNSGKNIIMFFIKNVSGGKMEKNNKFSVY